MKLILLAATFAIVTGFEALPAHAAVSQSTVENTLQKSVGNILTTQTTAPETIDPLFTDTTELEEIERETNDFPTNTEDAIAVPAEEIIARTTYPVANEDCFGADPATSTVPPVIGTLEETLPSDEEPTANDESFPPFKGWDELFQHLKNSEVKTEMFAT
jgi:hypothetical protein